VWTVLLPVVRLLVLVLLLLLLLLRRLLPLLQWAELARQGVVAPRSRPAHAHTTRRARAGVSGVVTPCFLQHRQRGP
jgi:hypothetical protein